MEIFNPIGFFVGAGFIPARGTVPTVVVPGAGGDEPLPYENN